MSKHNETIVPLHEWALVQVEKPAEEKSPGGLIVVRNDQKHPRLRAILLAKGPGEWKDGVRLQTEAEPGDVVLLQRHNLLQGLVYHDDENGPSLIPQSEIIAVVQKEDPSPTDREPDKWLRDPTGHGDD
jgi:co-chaperonin GroES (HSP10)